jgi:transposase
VVTLTETERLSLLDLLKKGEVKARMVTRARILLLSAEGATDQSIAEVLKVNPQTVRNIRKRFVAEGREAAVQERPRPGAQPNLDGKQEAFLIAPACSAPPEGREHWTMHLLADRLVELEVAESISDEPVRRVVNQTNASPGRSGSGASDRARLRFSGGWTMGATAPPNPPIPSARLSAWTNDRLNCWRMVGSPCRWNQVNPNGWMMHTSATARATCSCFSNPGAAGGPSM